MSLVHEHSQILRLDLGNIWSGRKKQCLQRRGWRWVKQPQVRTVDGPRARSLGDDLLVAPNCSWQKRVVKKVELEAIGFVEKRVIVRAWALVK